MGVSWDELEEGTPVVVGVIKLDRSGSTRDWDALGADEARRRRIRFSEKVTDIARRFGAAEPLNWQGDGVMLFLPGVTEAWACARELFDGCVVELGAHVRIAVHVAEVPWTRDTGLLASPELDRCGHLEHSAPIDAIAVTEDALLALPDASGFAPLGVTRRDGTAAWVWPAARAADGRGFDPGDVALRAALRRYCLGPEVRKLRYVGLRLQKAEPPMLDVDDVFVAPDLRPRPRPELPDDVVAALPEPLRTAWDAQPRGPVTVTDAWAAQRSLVVLGDPGAGKTTLLRWLAVVCSRGPVGVREALGSWERLVAVPVSVGRLADVRRALGEGPVTAALGRYFADRNVHDDPAAIGAFLARELEAGSCLVLLDGLDEVRQDERDAVVRWLETFAARYPANRFVVTSRVVGYAGFSLHGAAELVVDPLSDAQIERFVRVFTREYEAWALGVRDDRGADERAADLLAALGTGTGLRQLAANPFLLASLALIHRAEGRLPRHRVQAYEVFARALCETWGSARRLVAKERHEPDLPYEEEALPALGHLALRMHARFPSGVAPEAWVLDTLSDWLRAERGVAEPRAAARAFLDKAGRDVQILYERGHGEWGFSHLTFQEFFAAAGLHAAERYEDFLFRHLFEPRWREVLRLGMGYLALVQKRPKKAAELVQKVLEWEQPQPHQWLTSELWLNAVYAAIFDGECGDSIPNVLHAEIVARMMLLRLSGNFLTPPALEAVLTALGESAGLPEPDVDVAIERIREAVRGHNEERGGRRRPTTDPFDVSHGFRVLISLAAEIPAFRTELGDNFTKTPTGMATLTDDASLAELRTLASRGVKDASWALAWRGYPEAWPALSDLPTLDRLVALGRMYEAGRWIPAADDID